jgi:flagellar hook assembly protein FlgD
VAYPNPTSETFYVSFKIHASAQVTLKIYDSNGRLVATPLDGKVYDYGKHVLELEPAQLGLSAGNYLCVLTYEGKTVTRKITVN